MSKKMIKYIAAFLLIGILLYNAVHIEKLSKHRGNTAIAFNAKAFVDQIWQNYMPARITDAVAFKQFAVQLQQDTAKALETHTHALAIGNYKYVLINVQGVVLEARENDLVFQMEDGSKATIATEFIYGNAVRDASGLIDVKDFPNLADLNDITAAFNAKVKANVVPACREASIVGKKITLVAAVQLNQAHLSLQDLVLIPVQINVAS